jgi:iron complex outermembrane recepter protein
MKYNPDRLLFAQHPYLSADLVMTAPQENIVPPEEPTDGHMVLNLGAGFEFAARENRAIVSMQIINLLNKKYFNHTSYYRLINLPEPGRGFVFNITIPFSAKSFTDN